MRPSLQPSTRRSGLGALLVLFTLGAASGPAAAQLSPSVTLDPSQAPVGGTVVARGSALPAACGGQAAVIVLTAETGDEFARFPGAIDGAFEHDVVVPDLEVGKHVITTTCEAADAARTPFEVATTDFEVLAPATAEAAPASPGPDQTEAPTPIEPSPSTTTSESAPQPGSESRPAPATEPTAPAEAEHAATDTGEAPTSLARRDSPADDDDSADEATSANQPVSPDTALTVPAGAEDQVTDAGAWEPAPDRWGPAKDIRRLTDPGITAAGATGASLMLLAFSLLIGFPATMFNGTYRRHYDQIAEALRRRLGPIATATDRAIDLLPATPLVAMVAFGTLTAALVDPSLAFNGRSAGILAGLAVVVGLGGWLGWWPTKKTSDDYGNEGHYRAYPMGLLIAIACVALTRFGNLHPGYLYGMLFAYETRGRWSKRDDGLTFLLGFAVVFGVALVAWLGLSVLQPGAGESPAVFSVAMDTVLAGLTVVGVEGVVFGMVPFRFAPGRAIWEWSPAAWWSLWIPGVIALAMMLSTPSRELLSVSGQDAEVTRAAIAFVAFTAASVAFWNYWRRKEIHASRPIQMTAAVGEMPAQVAEPQELVSAP